MRITLAFLLVLQILRVCIQVVYKTKNVECFTFPKYAENASCFIKAINWNKAVAQMDVDLKKPLQNLSIRMEFFKKGYNNRYHPFLINVEFNFCDILSKKNYNLYGRALRDMLQEFTNLNHSCPFKDHLMVRNLYINETIMPVFPLGFYSVSLKFIENCQQVGESAGLVKFYFETMEKIETKRKKKI